MLTDKLLVQYFEQGFDDSLASATPNIPQVPCLHAKLHREAKERQRKAQAEIDHRDSELIMAKVRSRGYALIDEIESVLSLGPVTANLDALVLESLLPFSRQMDQALEQGNLQRVQSVSSQWGSWLKRSQGYFSQEAEESVQAQLSHLDKLDCQLGDPVLGKLTIKLARAIKEERWEDAKNIQSLIREMEPPEPKVVIAPAPQPTTRSQDDGEECARATQDYNQALAQYNAEKSRRSSSRLVQAAGIFGMLSPIPLNQAVGALYSGAGKNSANDSQADMDHALRLMQDAKRRMSIYCGN